ncbi:hypothetical protein ACFOSV_03875 [Algoriphagus namhaensis]|uniref:Uncharacterized protein n=1 Tax=Algoriphagus namhaensis TaxID=915353 RepID=A0ABV8AR65_9BACT
MKIWKSITVLILLAALVAGGIWVFQNYFSSKKINNLELISQEAIFVFESYNAAETWNDMAAAEAHPLLLNFPPFQKLGNQLFILDSLLGSQGALARELNGTQTTVSFHPLGKESFDLLFMINLREGSAQSLIEDIQSRLSGGERFQARTYSGQEILELFDGENERIWSVAFLDDLVLISASSFLVEEAIRFHENGELLDFSDYFSSEILAEKSHSRLLLSSRGVANFLKGVKGITVDPVIQKYEQYQTGIALNLELQDDELLFSGEITLDNGVNFTPSIQANLNEVLDAIPLSTTDLTQINLESIYETQKLKNLAFTPRATLAAQIDVELLSKGFLDTFYGGLYLVKLEKIGPVPVNLGLIARNANPGAAIELLKNYQSQEGDIVSDFYRGYEIILIDEQNFPSHLFEGKFVGFNQSWITAIGNILIFTNNQQSMKLILDEIENGETWGKSARKHPMQSMLSASSGFSKIVLMDKAWEAWTESASPAWSSYFQRYSASFQQFYGFAFRVNQYPDRLEATLTFPFGVASEPVSQTEPSGINLEPTKIVNLENRLIYGPKAILNYQDRSQDIVLQNDKNEIILLNSAGEIVYQLPLDGPIVSDAFQVDYYKNGKLQLLVATPSKIYGIDRLGNPLPNYPISLSGEKIRSLNLVDYSNTKAYRYFVSTEDGDLYLLDKTGEKLEGWNPNAVGAPSTGPARHVRVPRKGDYMLAFTEPGDLHLFDRRGNRKVAEPIRIGEGFKSPLVVFNNPLSNSMELVNISKDGAIVRVNFNGEITYTNQLVKEDRESEYLVVPDQGENEFLIVGKQFNKITFRNSQEEELFTISSSTESFEVQFFNFGSKRKIIVVTDLIQEFAYLYDFDGQLMTALPLESSGKLDIAFDSSGQQYLIRSVSGSQMKEYALAL